MQMDAKTVVLAFIGGNKMAVHHGGKVGKAAKTLASKNSSSKAKSSAGKTLVNHKVAKH